VPNHSAFWKRNESRVTFASSRNAVSFSSECTTKRFPSSRCASAIQIVRRLGSTPEPQAPLQPALLSHAEISRATEQADQGAAKLQPEGRVGPKALPMRTLLFRYHRAVRRVPGL
jgi:hypothetical protein